MDPCTQIQSKAVWPHYNVYMRVEIRPTLGWKPSCRTLRPLLYALMYSAFWSYVVRIVRIRGRGRGREEMATWGSPFSNLLASGKLSTLTVNAWWASSRFDPSGRVPESLLRQQTHKTSAIKSPRTFDGVEPPSEYVVGPRDMCRALSMSNGLSVA